jgi:hypothetical protein
VGGHPRGTVSTAARERPGESWGDLAIRIAACGGSSPGEEGRSGGRGQ